MKKQLDIDALIVKYFENELTLKERYELDSWITASPENKQYFIQYVKTWEATFIHIQDPAVAINRYSRFTHQYKNRKRRNIILGLSSVAAVLLLIISVFYFLPAHHDPVVVSTLDQKKEVRLPDGSVVWLNKNSQITYAQNFDSQRTVRLVGEAYFDVVNNQRKPFIVETIDLKIAVLGTRFVVTDYEDAHAAEAVLQSGKVQVEARETGENYMMEPGQMVSYDKDLLVAQVKTVYTQHFTNWVNSTLSFHNSALSDVFIQLEKWYGIRIVCTDSTILRTPVSFSVDTESHEEILNTLTLIAPFTWSLMKQADGEIPAILISKK